jgi:tetratricopeptide (TPR) repeat protein
MNDKGVNMRLCIVLLLITFCSGCASRVWVNPSKNDAEAQKDFRECKYDSEKGSYTPYSNVMSPISAGLQEGFQSVSLLSNCMESRGYRLVDKMENNNKVDINTQSMQSISESFKNRDYDKTIELAGKHLERYPGSSDAYMYRGYSYRNIDNFDFALRDFEEAINILKQRDDNNSKSTKLRAMSEKAICLLEKGEFDIAIELINICIDLDPMQYYLYNYRAYILVKKGDYDRAISDCNRSIALDGTKPNAYKNRGLAYFGKGQIDTSISEFNKAIALDPTYASSYLGRGDSYFNLGKIEDAQSDFRKACDLGNKEACKKINSGNIATNKTAIKVSVTPIIQENIQPSKIETEKINLTRTPIKEPIVKKQQAVITPILTFKKKVSFDHKAHSEIYDCNKCHNGSPDKISGFGKDYAHETCKGCHKDTGKGPTGCKACHDVNAVGY